MALRIQCLGRREQHGKQHCLEQQVAHQNQENPTLTQIESLQKEVMDLRELVEKCVETVERLENENAELRERHERMENQNRWDNLVFYGIPESDRERGKKVRKRYGTMLLNILIWAEPKPTWNSRLNELTVLERDHLEE